ncbi:hypothetical protein DPMN_033479 [Dreissena polymorpha]|uniref:NACHT domain-containing protein n=2 Tax=Dreissena polymorpha TaxID=45954 RepID=A0A9D4M734_DREPO|nr:hypothetical protein DPMN_033479 [Dreissena polymorpha]
MVFHRYLVYADQPFPLLSRISGLLHGGDIYHLGGTSRRWISIYDVCWESNFTSSYHHIWGETSRFMRCCSTVDLLKVQLNLLLKHGTAECPLVVILDSLDQLDTSHNGRSLMWLPASQPPHCKIIVSSLPEENYETFPVLKKLFPDEDRYIHVPELDQRDAHNIVALWAQKRNRTLTQTQMELLLTTFRKCPTLLFLKQITESPRRSLMTCCLAMMTY